MTIYDKMVINKFEEFINYKIIDTLKINFNLESLKYYDFVNDRLEDNLLELVKKSNSDFYLVYAYLQENKDIPQSIYDIVFNSDNKFKLNWLIEENIFKKITDEEFICCYLSHAPKFPFIIRYNLSLEDTIDLFLILKKNIDIEILDFVYLINILDLLNEFNTSYEFKNILLLIKILIIKETPI